LQMWHGLVLLIVISSFCATAYFLVRDNRVRRIDQQLQQRASALLDILRPPMTPPEMGRRGPPRFRPREWGPGHDEPDLGRPPFLPSRERLAVEIDRLSGQSEIGSIYSVIWGPDGRILKESDDAPEAVLPPDESAPELVPSIRVREHWRELAVANRRGFQMVVGHDMTPDFQELN